MVVNVNVDTAQVDRIVREAKVRYETALREFANQFALELVRATPVDTGFLRASWFLSFEDPRNLPGLERPPGYQGTGFESLATIEADAQRIEPGTDWWLANQAEYATYVENGTENQPGQFFVLKTTNRAQTIADQVITRIRSFQQ